MYVPRSQTEESKLDYSAYGTQQGGGTQHLAQQTSYLSESDFGSHVTATAKEEPTLFSVTSQPPQQSPLASTPTENEQQQQQQQQQDQQQQPQQPENIPTLADYNQSTSKGHEILSQVSLYFEYR